jgi:hypothetical protein
MEATYAGGKRVACIGDVVMAPGNLRGTVIAISGTFVLVLAIGTSEETGDTFVLTPLCIHDFPASDCSYLESNC